MLCVLDPALTAMVNRSIEADVDLSYLEAPGYFSQGRFRPGSQSPVRYSSRFGDISSCDFGFGSFVASTPEREIKRYDFLYHMVM